MRRIAKLMSQPPSRRRQAIRFRLTRLWTDLVYRRRLAACGPHCLVMRPLFWTPEVISLGANVLIWRDARIEGITEHGEQRFEPSIRIGSNVSIQQRAHIVCAQSIDIGDDTTISFDVSILDNDHSYSTIDLNVMDQPLTVEPVKIGARCFVGAGSRIHAGSQLGDHCIVGANAVVRGNFPSYCVIAGVPARIIKTYNHATGTWDPVPRDKR